MDKCIICNENAEASDINLPTCLAHRCKCGKNPLHWLTRCDICDTRCVCKKCKNSVDNYDFIFCDDCLAIIQRYEELKEWNNDG